MVAQSVGPEFKPQYRYKNLTLLRRSQEISLLSRANVPRQTAELEKQGSPVFSPTALGLKTNVRQGAGGSCL
jgi:hypothetical protein